MQELFIILRGGGLLLALISIPLIPAGKSSQIHITASVLHQRSTILRWYAVNKYFAKRQLLVALIEVIAATANFW